MLNLAGAIPIGEVLFSSPAGGIYGNQAEGIAGPGAGSLAVLLLLFIILLHPRINRIERSLDVRDLDWLKPKLTKLMLLALVGSMLVPDPLPDRSSLGIPTAQILMELLATVQIAAADAGPYLVEVLEGLLLAASGFLAGLLSYALLRSREAALLGAGMFMAWGLLLLASSPEAIPILLADAAMAATWLLMWVLVSSRKNTWRFIFTAPCAILACWLEPGYLSVIPLYFVFLILQTEDRSRIFAYPPSWVVLLLILLFAPLGILGTLSQPPAGGNMLQAAAMWLAGSGYAASFAWFMKILIALAAMATLLFHPASKRGMALLGLSFLLLSSALSMILLADRTIPILGFPGGLLMPSLMAAAGIRFIAVRIFSDRASEA